MKEVYINTSAGLADLCDAIASTQYIALDTEFMREKTYFSQLCLIQVAVDGLIACVDTLALDNIQILLDQLYRDDIVKILHSGRQDVEVLVDIRGSPLNNIFDTQIAASFLGHGEQVGYAALVNSELSIELAKEHTRTDWSKRPLDDGQLRYAADDVRYLFALYQTLTRKLDALGRRSWVIEECRTLSDAALYAKDSDMVWQRVKNWQSLHGPSLAYLKLLASWRETRAQNANCPRRWVLDDQALINFAVAMPVDENAAQGLFGDKFWQKNQRDIMQIMHQAKHLPDAEIPQVPQRSGLNPAQVSHLKRLQQAIRDKAQAMNLAASTLAKRADLESWVRGEAPASLSQGWRHDVLADILLVSRS